MTNWQPFRWEYKRQAGRARRPLCLIAVFATAENVHGRWQTNSGPGRTPRVKINKTVRSFCSAYMISTFTRLLERLWQSTCTILELRGRVPTWNVYVAHYCRWLLSVFSRKKLLTWLPNKRRRTLSIDCRAFDHRLIDDSKFLGIDPAQLKCLATGELSVVSRAVQ